MVWLQLSLQRVCELLAFGAHAAPSTLGDNCWIARSRKQGREHVPCGSTHDIIDDRSQLEIGILQRLVQAVDQARAFLTQLRLMR